MHAPASVCRMSDLGGELDALASGTGFSGVVRIDQGDRIELARAYGLAHRGFEIPNAVDTRFGLASGAKGFTALAVVSLIEAGVLELSTKVAWASVPEVSPEHWAPNLPTTASRWVDQR
jgi:CubicO group peptidase (beta-lactamase class C family)